MFYDQDSIDSGLTCQNCQTRFLVPKLLPCGDIICSKCEVFLTQNRQLLCPFCNRVHEIDENGLPIQKLMLKLVNLKPMKISRGELYEKLSDLLHKITSKVNSLKADGNGIENLQTYCQFLVNEVDIDIESRIIKLNEIRDKLIDEINQYRQECEAQIKVNDQANSEFINEILNHVQKLDNKLKTESNLCDAELNEDLNQLKLVESKMSAFEYKLKNQLFSGKQLCIENLAQNNLDLDDLSMPKLGYKSFKVNLDLEKFNSKAFTVYSYEQVVNRDDSLELNTTRLHPLDNSSILLISRYYNMRTHQISVELHVLEFDEEQLTFRVARHLQLGPPCVDLSDTINNRIVFIVSNANRTHSMQVYDSSLNLLDSIQVLDFYASSLKATDHGIYVTCKGSENLPLYCFYDWSLEKKKTVGRVDDIPGMYALLDAQNSKLIFSEVLNTKIYIYCETTEKIIKTIEMDTSMSQVHVDPLLRLFRIHDRQKKLTVFALNTEENNRDQSLVLYEDQLNIDTNYLQAFCITNNGYLIVQDNFNIFNFYIFH